MPPRTLRDAAFVGRDQMRSYSPSMAERVPQTLQDLLMRFGMDKFQARKTGKTLGDILALTPVGTLTAAADQYRDNDADLRAGRTPSSFRGGEVALGMLPMGVAAKAVNKRAGIFRPSVVNEVVPAPNPAAASGLLSGRGLRSAEDVKYASRNVSRAELDDALSSGFFRVPKGGTQHTKAGNLPDNTKWWSAADEQGVFGRDWAKGEVTVRVPIGKVSKDKAAMARDAEFYDPETGAWERLR